MFGQWRKVTTFSSSLSSVSSFSLLFLLFFISFYCLFLARDHACSCSFASSSLHHHGHCRDRNNNLTNSLNSVITFYCLSFGSWSEFCFLLFILRLLLSSLSLHAFFSIIVILLGLSLVSAFSFISALPHGFRLLESLVSFQLSFPFHHAFMYFCFYSLPLVPILY